MYDSVSVYEDGMYDLHLTSYMGCKTACREVHMYVCVCKFGGKKRDIWV